MRTVVLPDAGADLAAREAAQVLARGGIVLYPTDTLYGLAVNALDRNAIARLQDLKGREKGKPISVVVPDVEALGKYGVLSNDAHALAERLLPGALTLVVPAAPLLPAELMQEGAIGLRIPDDAFCLALAHVFKAPYTATSANRSGEQTPQTVAGVLEQFGERAHRIELVIDDGPRDGGTPSTIVSFVGEQPLVLREGAIPTSELGL